MRGHCWTILPFLVHLLFIKIDMPCCCWYMELLRISPSLFIQLGTRLMLFGSRILINWGEYAPIMQRALSPALPLVGTLYSLTFTFKWIWKRSRTCFPKLFLYYYFGIFKLTTIQGFLLLAPIGPHWKLGSVWLSHVFQEIDNTFFCTHYILVYFVCFYYYKVINILSNHDKLTIKYHNKNSKKYHH